MPPTYTTTGISLKTFPLGEADRIITILTPDQGLIRAVASGARKSKSSLSARTDLFVVNEWLLSPGRRQGESLERVQQVASVQTFNRLRTSFSKLTIAQYWAELVLQHALVNHAQETLYLMLIEHLQRLDRADRDREWAELAQGIFHLLAIVGIAPQVQQCYRCQSQLASATEVLFSTSGLLCEACASGRRPPRLLGASLQTLPLLRALPLAEIPPELAEHPLWLQVERLLRPNCELHSQRPIQAAALLPDSLLQTL